MAQTTATNRGPRGWDRLVEQLNAAQDFQTFYREMLDLQCKVVAAEYGALWSLNGENQASPIEFWPDPDNKPPNDSPLMVALGQSAKQGFERGVSHVLKLEAETADQSDLGAHVFVTVLKSKGKVAAVTTVIAECRDAQVLQSTAPLRELAAGLFEGFVARREAAQKDVETQRIRQTLALLAVSQEAQGFTGSALNLVNELARQLSCTRVSIGWVKGNGVKLVAMSDTEHLKRHSEQVALIELAMAECLDQQQPIVYPIPADAEPLLLHAVVHSHKRLVTQPGQYAVSLPLRHRDDWIGVVTLERLEKPFDSAMVQYMQLVVDVVAPQLDDRYDSDRWLVGHAWKSTEKTSAYLLGPKHVAWKLGAVAAIAVLLVLLLGSWTYRVSAPFELEAHSRRILPAPFEGKIEKVFKEPGDFVKTGDVLAKLDTRALALQLDESRSKLELARLDHDQKLNEGKWSDAAQAKATGDQMQAQINLYQYEIDEAVLRSPVDGWVVSASLSDKIGGMVKQGDEMFHVAPVEDLVAVLHIDESDITQITPEKPQTGRLATRSMPEKSFEFKTLQLVPAASPVNNINSFELRAKLDQPEEWMKPGMQGLAKVDVGSKRLYWILTHRITDTIRLWTWW